MKGTLKKVIALAAAGTVISGILPTARAENSSEENVLVSMNFENYSEGDSIAGKIDNARISVENAADGNSVTVQKDTETGSLAVKMVRSSESTKSLNMFYSLDSAISTGKYKISYDSKIEKAVGNFASLGSMQTDPSWKNIFNPRIFGGTGLYNGQSDWIADYKGKIGNEWAHHEIVADFDAAEGVYTVNGGTANVTKSFDIDAQEAWKYLTFSIQPINGNNSLNAWETNQSGENEDAVYWIDNITIEEVVESGVIAQEDFEDYTAGDALNDSWVKTKLTGGNTATVETDPLTGSKAIKMVKGADASAAMALDYDLKQNLSEGKYVISYDVRIDTATKYFQAIGATRNSSWSDIYTPRLKSGELYRGDTQFSPKFDYKNRVGYDYATFTHVLDIDNKTDEFSVYKDGKLLMSNQYTYEKSVNNFRYLNFAVSTDNLYHVNAWDAVYAEDGKTTAENNPDGVMYIDNLKIEKYKFKTAGISVSGENASVDSDISVSFNGAVDAQSVTKDNFIIEKSGAAVSDYSLELSQDAKTVSFVLADGLEYDTEYSVKVSKNVTSGGTALSKDYESTFKTEKYIDSEVIMNYNFEDMPEGDFSTTGLIKKVNVADGDKVQIVKDEYGTKALYIERAEENVASNSATELSFSLPKTVSNGIVKISQSIRCENYRAGISQLLSVQDKKWANTDRSYFHGGFYYAAENGTYGYDMAKMDSSKYLTIEKTINFDTKDYTVNYYIDGNKVYGGGFTLPSVKDFDWLYLTVAKDNAYNVYGDTGAGKYYFDNIKVEYIKAPEIVMSSPVNGAKNVKLSSVVTLTANTQIKKASVNKDNIKVFKDGVLLDDYSLGLNDRKTITVDFEKSANSKYTIKVNGLIAEGANGAEMTKEYVLEFAAEGAFSAEFTKAATDLTNPDKFSITADIVNNAVQDGMSIVFAGYDEYGRLVYAKSMGDAIACGDGIYETVTLDKAAEVRAYIWDSLTGMKAIDEPIEITVPENRTYGADTLSGDGDITIAFIGGSITEQQQWITPLKSYFNEKYSGRNVNYVVAGVGGTGTGLQQYRVYNDIISQNPDLVFIDPTINDSSWPYDVDASYENVVRQLLEANHQPAVIRVAFGRADGENWIKANEQHTSIDSYYGIKCINAAEFILENLADENNAEGFVWTADENYPNAKVLTKDGTHPTKEGGEYIADYIKSELEKDLGYISKLIQQPTAKTALCDEYKNAREISLKTAQFSDGWTVADKCPDKFHDGSFQTSTDGATVTVSFYGKGIAIYNYGGADGMDIAYSADNGAINGTVSSFVNGWDFNQAGSTRTIAFDTKGYHTVTFTAATKGNANESLIMGYFLVY